MFKYIFFTVIFLVILFAIKFKSLIDNIDYSFKINNIGSLVKMVSLKDRKISLEYVISTLNKSSLSLKLKDLNGYIYYKGFKVFRVDIPVLYLKSGVNESKVETEIKADLGLINLAKDFKSGKEIIFEYNLNFKLFFMTIPLKGFYKY